jgi:hypothetical protein
MIGNEPSIAAPRAAAAGRGRSALINLALYQGGWLACVLGAAGGRPWAGAGLALVLVAVHLALVRDRGREARLLLAAGALGLALDSMQLNLGVFRYPTGTPLAGLAPPWIVVLWLQFATLLHFGLRWMAGRYRLAALLGFVGGPLSFWGGERLGAIEFASPTAYVALACVWAVAMPTLIWLADRLEPRQEGYR